MDLIAIEVLYMDKTCRFNFDQIKRGSNADRMSDFIMQLGLFMIKLILNKFFFQDI